MKELFRVTLDTVPFTWGGNDLARRTHIRQLIRKKYPGFSPEITEKMVDEYQDVTITINCYLDKSNIKKDIDNLAKIPLDAIFYSAKNEKKEPEIGHIKHWENKITSLTINKFDSDTNQLEIIIYGTPSGQG